MELVKSAMQSGEYGLKTRLNMYLKIGMAQCIVRLHIEVKTLKANYKRT